MDLSTHQIFIAYVYTETESGSIFPSIGVAPYHCEDVEVDGEDITFSWKLTGNVFKNPGFILFKMYAKKTETDPNTVFNTTPAIGTVLATIPDGTEEIKEEYPDVIAQIFDRLDALESGGGGGTGGTTNYNNLSNKPQLNGVTLEGNKTLDQVGVLAKNQGASNSGKYLSVGSDGNVVPADAPSGGTVDPEQIKQAVNGYLEENPVSGMTAEQEQQLNQNTQDVADLKSAMPNVDSTLSNTGEAADAKVTGEALKGKTDTFYTKESQLKDFGQIAKENEPVVEFGNAENPLDFEKILTENEHLYICARVKEDYWNSGNGIRLVVFKTYQQFIAISGDNLFTSKSIKDDMENHIFGYITLNCAEILAAIKQMIAENSYESVYGFIVTIGQNISRFDTPWYIGTTIEEPTEEMFNRNFQYGTVSEDFRTAVSMVLGLEDGETDPDTETDLSPLAGKYGMHIGDSYTYAMAGSSGALTAYNASIGMAGTLNYGIVSSTIRDRKSETDGYAYKPMVCRVCHTGSKDQSGSTISSQDDWVPLDRDDIGYITFMGGTNDSPTYPDSTGTDMCDGERTHIYGAMNLIMSKLVESYPDVPIIVILQPYYANKTESEVSDMSGNKNMVDVSTLGSKLLSVGMQTRKQKIVREVATLFSKAYENVHVIDCCFNWFNPLNEEEYAAFWSQADNGLHLSTNGYNQIVNGETYDSISKKINEIFTVNTSNT